MTRCRSEEYSSGIRTNLPSRMHLKEFRVNRVVVVTEAGSYSMLIDSCITQLKAQGPPRTCNESKEEEELPLPSEERLTQNVWRTFISR